MKPVTIYTWTICPYCDRAKALLKNKNVPYEEVNLDGRDDELKALRERTGFRTVPQIFVGDHFVGGFSDLSALEQKGELDTLLKD